MAAPIPLRRCFSTTTPLSLESYDAERLTNANPGSSSGQTATMDPPRFAHKVSTDYWTPICQNFLRMEPNMLTDEYLSRKEAVMRHASEADVVRTAALYVLHAINQAFSAHRATTRTVTCLSEFSSTNLRADITYFKNPQTPGGNKRAFAVIEFKKRHLINTDDFEFAEQRDSDVTEAQVRLDATQISGDAMGRNADNTFYENYSRKLLKQASAYAINHRTKYVALFNWEVLVLIRFQAMELLDNGRLKSVDNLKQDGVGEWCQTTVITQSSDMRPALLGFLAEAYNMTPF